MCAITISNFVGIDNWASAPKMYEAAHYVSLGRTVAPAHAVAPTRLRSGSTAFNQSCSKLRQAHGIDDCKSDDVDDTKDVIIIDA